MSSEPFRAANFYDVGVSWLSTDAPASWKADAACGGLTLEESMATFFPHGHGIPDRILYAKARVICGGCPVLKECLDDAFTWESSPEQGFLGGLSPKDRHKERMRRQGRRKRSAA